jgi:small GTP-binding protein
VSLFDRLSRRFGDVLDDLTLPDRLRNTLEQAEQSLDQGDAGRALVLARTVLGERAVNARGLWVVARSHEALGEWGAAAGAWLEFVRLRDALEGRMGLARCALALGDLLTASEQLDAALRMATAPTERTELRLALATVHAERGRPEAAAPLLRVVLRELPERVDVALQLARALRADGDHDGAIAALAPMVGPHCEDAELLRVLARLYQERGGSDDDAHAGRAWDRLLTVAPDHPEALLALARIHLRRGRLAESMPLLQHALAVAPLDDHAEIHAAMGEANARCGQWERAIDPLRAAVALADANPAAWEALARVALELGLLDEADDAAARAIALGATRDRAALRGRILLDLGRVEDAREQLTPLRAARMGPEELHALGALALASGDTTEAVALLREAALHETTRARVEHDLARAFALLAPDLPAPTVVEPAAAGALVAALASMAAASPLLVELASRLNALRSKIDTPLAIAVLGEFNAGKSTLINAFVGEEMLAMGVLPTTSHINAVQWGPRRVARLTERDGTERELPFDEAAQIVRRAPDSIERLEFCFPHPDLRAVHFWDTPGMNAPDADHERRAREALRSADAILWLLDVHQALSASELERITEVEGAADKLIVVVNKIDRLGDDAAALDEVLAHVRTPLEGRCAAIVALSAREALHWKLRAAAEPYDDVESAPPAGWALLQETVQRLFHERAGYLKASEALRGVLAIVDEALHRAGERDAQFTSAGREIAALRETLEAAQRTWATEQVLPWIERERRTQVRQRERVEVDLDAQLGPAQGIFGRPRIRRDDAIPTLRGLRERLARTLRDELDGLVATLSPVDSLVAATVERIAQIVGPPESRTERGRLEAWIAETVAYRRLLHEQLWERRVAVLDTRFDLEGADLLLRWVEQERSEERSALLQRLLPIPDERLRYRAEAWSREYFGAGIRLCDHVQRDLDMLALDLEHRIIRPLATLRASLCALPSFRDLST